MRRDYTHPMIPTGATRRLLLRPIELADANQIQQLFPHWEIVRYLLNRVPWPYPRNGAFTYIRDNALPAMKKGEAWHWTICLRPQPDQIIGVISLMKGENENRGFWMGLPWQGQGYMSEACIWANDFWFDTLGFERLRAPKSLENVASRRISEKQGMRVIAIDERDYVSGRAPAEIWEITAGEWRAWKNNTLTAS